MTVAVPGIHLQDSLGLPRLMLEPVCLEAFDVIANLYLLLLRSALVLRSCGAVVGVFVFQNTLCRYVHLSPTRNSTR